MADVTERRRRGRPPREMPDPIPDTPENIARALVTSAPKDEWRYLADSKPDDQ